MTETATATTITLADLPKLGQPLAAGIFAGLTTQPDGTHCAVVLLPAETEKGLTWEKAMNWAEGLGDGAALPTRPVAALLFANACDQFKRLWHWTSESLYGSGAWGQYFDFGSQLFNLKSYEGRARAVRLIPCSLDPSILSHPEVHMTTVTLENLKAEISLAPGEHYAGIVLDEDGDIEHHLVLLPDDRSRLTWDQANDWARAGGGDLPTRQEQALLYANLKAQFKPDYYWSREPLESRGSYAWNQYFGDGGQSSNHKSYEGRARAVRRVTT